MSKLTVLIRSNPIGSAVLDLLGGHASASAGGIASSPQVEAATDMALDAAAKLVQSTFHTVVAAKLGPAAQLAEAEVAKLTTEFRDWLDARI